MYKNMTNPHNTEIRLNRVELESELTTYFGSFMEVHNVDLAISHYNGSHEVAHVYCEISADQLNRAIRIIESNGFEYSYDESGWDGGYGSPAILYAVWAYVPKSVLIEGLS